MKPTSRPRVAAPLSIAGSVTALLLSADLSAQEGSFLQNLPSAFILDDSNSAGPGGNKFDINSPLNGQLIPYAPSAYTSVPNFNIQLMFPNHFELMSLDAMSTGNDLVPIQVDPTSGVPTIDPLVPQQTWVALNISLRDGATGAPGSKIEGYVQAQLPNPAGAAVFSYHFPGSFLPETVLDQVFVEHGPGTASGLSANGADVVAFDTFVQAIANANGQNQPMFPTTNLFFFSLTRESAQAMNDAWLTDLAAHNADPQNVPYPEPFASDSLLVHESSIYMVRWFQGAWTTPVTQFHYHDLGVPALKENANNNLDEFGNEILWDDFADIDAIGVHVVHQDIIQNDGRLATSPKLFYSFRRGDDAILQTWPEILFLPEGGLTITPGVGPGSSTTPAPDLALVPPPTPPQNIKNSDGINLEDLFGIDLDDDIDAICFNDPQAGSHSAGFSNAMPDPQQPNASFKGKEIKMSLCAVPQLPRTQMEQYQMICIVVSGDFGASTASPSLMGLEYRLPGTSTWNPLQLGVRTISTATGAHRFVARVNLPFGSESFAIQYRAVVVASDGSRTPLATYPVEHEA